MAGSPRLVTYDYNNLIVSANVSGTLLVENDIYSDWKEDVVLDATGLAASVPPAFLEVNPKVNGERRGGSIGGNDLGQSQSISPYFFLNNIDGWRFRPAEEDGETTLQGNIFPLDPDRAFIVPTVGNFSQLVRLLVSPQSITTQTNVSGLTAAESQALLFIQKLLRNEMITTKQGETVTLPTSPETIIPGGKITLLDDDNLTVLLQADLFEDAQEAVPYRGKGVERRKRMT